MGYTRWSSDAYTHLKTGYAKKSRADIFKADTTRTISADMNPHGLLFRESRDSVAHPNALAVAVFLDVTGSMGQIPEKLIRHKLGALMNTLIDHGVADPHVMFSAIGDHLSDRAPLQVGQFESGTQELNEGLSKIFIEGGGGGQNKESYLLAWLTAGRHTSIDCFEKRGKKGFLFTIGDEKTWEEVDSDRLKNIMGYEDADYLTAKDVLAQAQRMYHVFHIHINETGYKNNPEILGSWRDLLGERLLILDDHNALAELIASTVAVINGVDLDTVSASFDDKTADMVRKSLVKVTSEVSPAKKRGIFKLF